MRERILRNSNDSTIAGKPTADGIRATIDDDFKRARNKNEPKRRVLTLLNSIRSGRAQKVQQFDNSYL